MWSMNLDAVSYTHLDLIMGPVANDQLYATIRLYEQGVVTVKRSAEKRAYVFEVSIEYLWNLFQEQKQICHL